MSNESHKTWRITIWLLNQKIIQQFRWMLNQNIITQEKWKWYIITCLGLAPPRRTSNNVAHRRSVWGNLNSWSDITEKMGCILELAFLWLSKRYLGRPTAMLKNFDPFFSDGRPTSSLPRNCKLSNLIGSKSLN